MTKLAASMMALLVSLTLLQGFYASHLNTLFYSRYGPFFDSMAYTNQLADILSIAKDQGILAGLRASIHSGTVSLPWMVVSLLSPVLEYSRLIGVWMQEFWMAVLVLSVFAYLHFYRGASAVWAAAVSVPFISFWAVYRHNGGISDFRMDLSLYLFLSLTGIWYLAAVESESLVPWALSGLSLCLAILNRATAPVYFAAMFGPVIFFRLVLTPPGSRLKLLLRAGISWGVGLAAGIAALASNWAFIHYYYFVWGADPNANLPFSVSAGHFYTAVESVGRWLVFAATLMCCLQLIAALRDRSPWPILKAIDWEIFYLGFAPALMLALQGAGLNFLASMPSVFGWLLFAIVPLRGTLRISWLGSAGAAAMLTACGYYAVNAYAAHTEPGGNKVPMMAALQRGIGLMEADAIARGKSSANFGTAHIVDFHTAALRNVLIYDRGAKVRAGGYLLNSGLTFRADQEWVMSPAMALNWNKEVPGDSDEAKCAYLVKLANSYLDYIFLPDDDSISWMEKHRSHNFINTKMRMFKQALLSTRRWTPVGEPLAASDHERVNLFVRH